MREIRGRQANPSSLEYRRRATLNAYRPLRRYNFSADPFLYDCESSGVKLPQILPRLGLWGT